MIRMLLLSALFSAISLGSSAQPGTLDGDFNADGKVTTDLGSDEHIGRSVVIQPDGTSGSLPDILPLSPMMRLLYDITLMVLSITALGWTE